MSGDYTFGPVVYGNTERANPDDIPSIVDDSLLLHSPPTDKLLLLGLHFHPEAHHCPVPSEGDLSLNSLLHPSLRAYKTDYLRPILGVANILYDGRIPLIMYQRNYSRIRPSNRDYHSTIAELPFSNIEDTVESIRQTGLVECLGLWFSPEGRGYRLQPTNPPLHLFSYQPILEPARDPIRR